MEELFYNLGFRENPFSRFSAEEETDYIDNIFSPPKYYQTIYSDIFAGTSRFILEGRGIGKSALMFKLKNQLDSRACLTILIDQYDNIPETENEKQLLIEILKKLVINYSIILMKNPQKLKHLDKHDKERLACFILLFFESLSATEYQTIYNKATRYQSKNALKTLFNWVLLKPINITLSGVSEVISTTIAKSLGLPYQNDESSYKKFIPELNIEKFEESGKDLMEIDYKRLKELLKDLSLIIRKTEFERVVIFFDKIDEYPKLKGNIKKISEFLKPITQDTSLLQIQDISFVFIIWDKVKAQLIGIRFDKFKPIDISWTDQELMEIINKRLKFFSKEQNIRLEDIVRNPIHLNKILRLSSKSPRDLIMLLSRIYEEQGIINSRVYCFSPEAIQKGIDSFIENYDYHSVYQGTIDARIESIDSIMDKMVKVGKKYFINKDVAAVFKISPQKATSLIVKMSNYGLIDKTKERQGQEKAYIITDEKVIYRINKKNSKNGHVV